jgi:hypothetical protein
MSSQFRPPPILGLPAGHSMSGYPTKPCMSSSILAVCPTHRNVITICSNTPPPGGKELSPLPGERVGKSDTNNQQEEHNFYWTMSTRHHIWEDSSRLQSNPVRQNPSSNCCVFLSPGSRILLQPSSGINITGVTHSVVMGRMLLNHNTSTP